MTTQHIRDNIDEEQLCSAAKKLSEPFRSYILKTHKNLVLFQKQYAHNTAEVLTFLSLCLIKKKEAYLSNTQIEEFNGKVSYQTRLTHQFVFVNALIRRRAG
jgi:hypothetical protein